MNNTQLMEMENELTKQTTERQEQVYALITKALILQRLALVGKIHPPLRPHVFCFYISTKGRCPNCHMRLERTNLFDLELEFIDDFRAYIYSDYKCVRAAKPYFWEVQYIANPLLYYKCKQCDYEYAQWDR